MIIILIIISAYAIFLNVCLRRNIKKLNIREAIIISLIEEKYGHNWDGKVIEFHPENRKN